MATTAEMRYRTYVPYGWIATEFCSVDFFGDNAEDLKFRWHEIAYEKYRKTESKIQKLGINAANIKSEIEDVKTEYNSNKKWYRFWKTKEDKALLSKISDLQDQYNKLNEMIEEMNENKYDSAYQLKNKLHEFLTKNHFRCLSHSTKGNECVTEIEIWEHD